MPGQTRKFAVSLDHAVYGYWIILARFCGFLVLLNAIAVFTEKTLRFFACIPFDFAIFDPHLRPPQIAVSVEIMINETFQVTLIRIFLADQGCFIIVVLVD